MAKLSDIKLNKYDNRVINNDYADYYSGGDYVVDKFWGGFLRFFEGASDAVVGIPTGIAGLATKNQDVLDFATKQFKTDWFDYERPDRDYQPTGGWKFAGDVAAGLGNSFPTFGMTFGVGAIANAIGKPVSQGALQALSYATIGLSAAGQGTSEAVKKTGELGWKELGYGALSGAVEAGTEAFGGKVLKAGSGRIVNSIAGSFAKDATKSVAKTTVGQAVKGLLKDFAEEGFEEFVSAVLEPGISRITGVDPDAPWNPSDIAYQALVGGLSGLIMGAGDLTAKTATHFVKGNQAIGNGKAASIIEMAKRLSDPSVANSLDEDTYKGIVAAYKELTESMKKTDGKISTVRQKTLLGYLQEANFVAIASPMIYKEMMNILKNADAVAKAASGFLMDENGNKINVTAEQLREGVDLNEKNEAKLRKQLAKAMKENRILTGLAVASFSGKLVMQTNDFIRFAQENLGAVTDESLAQFLETADEGTKAALGEALGIKNWKVATASTVNEALRNNAGKIQEAQTRYENLRNAAKGEAKEAPSAFGKDTADGTYETEDGYRVVKNGDEYHLYDSKGDRISRSMTESEVNEAVKDYKEGKANATENRAKAEAEAFAEKNVPEYAKLSESAKRSVRMTIRQGLANDSVSEEETILCARIAAKTGLAVVFDENMLKFDGKGKTADGMFDMANTIYINPSSDRTKTIRETLTHEAAHWLLNAGVNAKAMSKLSLEGMRKEMPEKMLNVIQKYTDYYKSKGKDVTSPKVQAILLDEINSRYAEEIMGNAKFLEQILDADTTVRNRFQTFVRKWMDKMSSIEGVTAAGNKFIKQYTDAFRKLSEYNEGSNAFSSAIKERRKILGDTGRYNAAFVEKHKEKLEKAYDPKEAKQSLEDIMKVYNRVVKAWNEIGIRLDSKFLNEWNAKKARFGNYTIFKEQSGYKYTSELSSMCKKGVPLFMAIDTIVRKELMKQMDSDVMGKEEKEVMYRVLQNHGYEIPCAICYVEQARQGEGRIIKNFLNGTGDKIGWNTTLKAFEKKMHEAGVDYKFDRFGRDITTDAYNPKPVVMSEEEEAAFVRALTDVANAEIRKVNAGNGKSKKALIKNATLEDITKSLSGNLNSNLTLLKVLALEPDSRKTIGDDMLYSSMTTGNLSGVHPRLYSLFNSQGGTGGFKTKQTPVIYLGDILGKKYAASTVRKEGGIRNQSNSDLQAYLILDMFQLYADLAAKGYYMHAYTKVLAELKLFGLCGAKINASLIPKVKVIRNADGTINIDATKENAGLDENGELLFDTVEGIDPLETFMLCADPEYSKNVGAICIAYSDKHMWKLLDDPRIQLIIGFHDKTNDPTKRYKGAQYAENYNGRNEAKDETGTTQHITFGQYLEQAEKLFGYDPATEKASAEKAEYNGKTYVFDDIPRLAAQMYKDDLASKGWTCAYDMFKDHPNYYKLLGDFTLYNSEGHYAPHKKVRLNIPTTVPVQYEDYDGTKEVGGAIRNVAMDRYVQYMLDRELRTIDNISADLAETGPSSMLDEMVKGMNDLKKNQPSETVYADDERYSIPDVDSDGNKLSSQQREYFKDSKVVDNQGRLSVVYHGTDSAGFTKFRTPIGRGAWFTNNRYVAEGYAEGGNSVDILHPADTLSQDVLRAAFGQYGAKFSKDGDGYRLTDEDGNSTHYDDLTQATRALWDDYISLDPDSAGGVYSTYLNITNPFVYDGKGRSWDDIADDSKVAKAYGYVRLLSGDDHKGKYRVAYDIISGFEENTDEYSPAYPITGGNISAEFTLGELYDTFGVEATKSIMDGHTVSSLYLDKDNNRLDSTTDDWVKKASSQGYDGVIFKNIFDGSDESANIYVAFKPEQIKDTRNRKPTADEDIRLSLPDNIDELAKAHFGTTTNWKETGYLLKDGTQLDFSGRHWGGTERNTRQVDHGDVKEIIDGYDGYKKAQIAYVNEGNIRIIPETPGINLAVAPTEEQYAKLRTFINRMRQYGFIVDYDDERGYTAYTKEYDAMTSADTIIADIKDYFENGKPAEKSDVAMFHERYSLPDVDPIQPTTDGWKRSLTFDEVKAQHPDLWDVEAEEADEKNPTSVKSTLPSYEKIFNALKEEGFNGRILDASSGLGYGTELGKDKYGFDVEDVEPFPGDRHEPTYRDYAKINGQYDVIISNAVLNVLPQDIRDSLVKRMGELLAPGGRIFVNVRGDDVMNASSKDVIDKDNLEVFISSTGSYQKGFRKPELVAYLKDALGDGYDVKATSFFGKTSAVVTKKAQGRYSLPSDEDYMKAVESKNDARIREILDEAAKRAFPNSILIQDGEFKKMWHHTNAEFNEFLPGTTASSGGLKGIYFTPQEHSNMSNLGNKHKQYYLNVQNMKFAFGVPKDKKYVEMLKERQAGVSDREELARINREFADETGIDAFFDWQNGWYNVLKPELIKSADLVTYDDNGNVIPLSKRFSQENEDIRYSFKDEPNGKVWAGLDAEYQEAVANNDEKKMSKILEKAARLMGFDSPLLYHGTDSFGFTEFDLGKGEGTIFATSSKDVAGTYSDVDFERRIADTEPTEERIKASKEDLHKASKKAAKNIATMLGLKDELYFDSIDLERAAEHEVNVTDGNNLRMDSYDAVEDLAEEFYSDYYEKVVDKDRYPSYEDWRKSKSFESVQNKFLTNWNAVLDAYRQLDPLLYRDAKTKRHPSSGLYQLYGKLGKSFTMDANGSRWNDLKDSRLPPRAKEGYTTREVADWAKQNGYDSVVIRNVRDTGNGDNIPGDIYIFFNASQVKSADPITYDDNGNIIPISYRFTDDNDFRFSMPTDKEPKRYTQKELESALDDILLEIEEQASTWTETWKAKLRGKSRKDVLAFLSKEMTNAKQAKLNDVARKAADYIIDRTIMAEVIEQDEDAQQAAMFVNIMNGYRHRIDVSMIKDEIRYHYDDRSREIFLQWAAPEGDYTYMTADMIAKELAGQNISIGLVDADAPQQDLLIGLLDHYKVCKELLERKAVSLKLNEFGKEAEVEQYRQLIAKDIMKAFDEKGSARKPDPAVVMQMRYEEEVSRLRKELKNAAKKNAISNRVIDLAKELKDNSIKKYVSSTVLSNPLLDAWAKELGKLVYRSNLRRASARDILLQYGQFYNEKNDVLKDWYESLGTELDANVLGALDLLRANASNPDESFKPLSYEELQAAEVILGSAVALFKNFDSSFLEGKRYRTEELAKEELTLLGQGLYDPKSKKVFRLLDNFIKGTIEPRVVLEMLEHYDPNGVLTRIFKEIAEAETKAGAMRIAFMTPFDQFFKKYKGYTKRLAKTKVTINGNAMTINQAISLYETCKREQAMLGLARAGYSFTNEDGTTTHVPGKYPKATPDEAVTYAEQLAKAIESQLNGEDMEFIKLVEHFFNTDSKTAKTDADLQFIGYTNVLDEFYYPIHRDPSTIASSATNVKSFLKDVAALNNYSFNKNTKKNAATELYIGNVYDMVTTHAKQMSLYASLALPMQTFDRVYNKNVGTRTNVNSVRKYLNDNVWAGTDNYIKKLMSDIQGVAMLDEGFNAFGWIRGKFASFQLGANPKVVLAQAASLPTAATMLDADSIVKGLLNKVNFAELDKYSDYARVRNYDQTIVKAEGVIDKVSKVGDATTKPIQMMDRLTVGWIWNACQYQVAKNGPAYGTEANKVEAAKLFETVCRETQPNYTNTERSSMMRSQSEFKKTLTMFTSVPLKQYSRLVEAAGAYAYARKTGNKRMIAGAGKKLRKVIAAILAANLVYCMIGQLFTWLFNKKRKDKYGNEIGFVQDYVTDVAVTTIGMVPVLNQLTNFFVKGYDVSGFDFDVINDFLNTSTKITNLVGKAASGKPLERSDFGSALRSMIYTAGQMTGIPTRNVMNTVMGLFKRFSPEASYQIDGWFYNEDYRSDLAKYVAEGNEGMSRMLMELYTNQETGGTSEAARNVLLELYTQGYDVLPKAVSDTISYTETDKDGNKKTVSVTLNGKQQTAFRNIYSQVNDVIDAMIASKAFKALNEEDQARAIRAVYNAYYAKAKDSVVGTDSGNTLNMYFPREQGKFATVVAGLNEINADLDKKGNPISGTKKTKVFKYLRASGLSVAEAYYVMALKGYSLSGLGQSEEQARKVLLKYILSLPVTQKEKAEIAQKCGFEVKNNRIVNKKA